MLNALTIDLEDWYQGLTSTSWKIDQWSNFEDRVEGNTERLLNLLSRAGVKATFFVLGYVADQFPDLIHRVAEDGHEIGLHGYYHHRVNQLTLEEFREDIHRGIDAVQKASGKEVQGYRAPMFSINGSSNRIFEELSELGFTYDSSIFPIRNIYYGVPRAPRFPYHPIENSSFIEFPIATVKLLGINWPIGGGFYLRSIPYRLIKAGIRKLNDQGKLAVMYLHPWEIDTGQNYYRVTLRERLTHYHGRASLENKLWRLLVDFNFAPLSDLIENTTKTRKKNASTRV